MMSTSDKSNWPKTLLDGVALTGKALAEAELKHYDPALLRANQSVSFIESMLGALERTFPYPPHSVEGDLGQAVDSMLLCLREARVAALAIQGSAQPSRAVLERTTSATEDLERAARVFLERFRTILRQYAPARLKDEAGSQINRYEEQLEARQLAIEVRETRDQANSALIATRQAAGMTGEVKLAQYFGMHANAERESANRLRRACIGVLLIIAMIAVALLVDSGTGNPSTAEEMAKLAVTIPLAALAAYLGREASRHRDVSRRAKELEIQLQTVDAFTAPLPDELRNQIRTELSKQVFATVYENDGTAITTPFAAGELLDKIADLLKAVRPSEI